MRVKTLYLLAVIFSFLLTSNGVHAVEQCEYPDQYPFNNKNCDENEVLEWDAVKSIEELGPNDSGNVYVLGGTGPYEWTVTGNGFYFDQLGTVTTLKTDVPTIVLNSIGACGVAEIKVIDACDRELIQPGHVVSQAGYWKWVDLSEIPYDFPLTANETNGRVFVYQDSMYRVSQYWQFTATSRISEATWKKECPWDEFVKVTPNFTQWSGRSEGWSKWKPWAPWSGDGPTRFIFSRNPATGDVFGGFAKKPASAAQWSCHN